MKRHEMAANSSPCTAATGPKPLASVGAHSCYVWPRFSVRVLFSGWAGGGQHPFLFQVGPGAISADDIPSWMVRVLVLGQPVGCISIPNRRLAGEPVSVRQAPSPAPAAGGEQHQQHQQHQQPQVRWPLVAAPESVVCLLLLRCW